MQHLFILIMEGNGRFPYNKFQAPAIACTNGYQNKRQMHRSTIVNPRWIHQIK